MGHRTLKRVPLDFEWPMHKVWEGYICRLGGPCPEEGKTCFNGSTAAGMWLDSISQLIAMVGNEAASARNVEHFKITGRIYPHPYLEEWSQAPRTRMPNHVAAELRELEQPERNRAFNRWYALNPATLLPLTDELIPLVKGLGADELGGIGSSNGYRIFKKLREVSGLPETWGVCPVCEGNGDDPQKRAAAEAWMPTEPPKGEGFQLWETCSEGSPVSPVFKTADELASWCAVNATTFASFKASKEEWLKMFSIEDGVELGSMVIAVVPQ